MPDTFSELTGDVQDVFESKLAKSVFVDKYVWGEAGERVWADTVHRVATSVMGGIADPAHIDMVEQSILQRKFIPGGRQLYAAGRPFHQVNNCFLLTVEDTRRDWANLVRRAHECLLTGGGVGVEYSRIRPAGSELVSSGGVASGALSLMQTVNDMARHVIQGGQRRPALWAGLHWKHGDIFDFIHMKDWDGETKAAKARDFTFPAPMDVTNISVRVDPEFFAAYHNTGNLWHPHAVRVFNEVTERMCIDGEPGFTNNWDEQILRNACTEVISADDNDVCCLGSINLAAIQSLPELRSVVYAATKFLLCSTVYSDTPFDEIIGVRDRNRRIGLGLMGIHEWLLQRGYRYGVVPELHQWLRLFQRCSREYADIHATDMKLRQPIAVNSIAPTGTLSILAETTGGIEPIYCSAYRRRYHSHAGGGSGTGIHWKEEIMVDPVVQRLINQGVDPSLIEDSYTLAAQVDRRIQFQADIQQYIDQAISSTINLPPWGTQHNNQDTLWVFRDSLLRHLPNLRGITAYPDGSRAGQPLTPVPLLDVIEKAIPGFAPGSFCDTVCG